MKRAGRWLFNFTAAVSLLLCIVLVVLSVRSFWKVLGLAIEHRSGTCFWVEIERGQLAVWKLRRVRPATQPFVPLWVIQSGGKTSVRQAPWTMRTNGGDLVTFTDRVGLRPLNVVTSRILGFGGESISPAPFNAAVAAHAIRSQDVDQGRDAAEAADEAVRQAQARGEPADQVEAQQRVARLRRRLSQADQVAAAVSAGVGYTQWQVTAPMWALVAMTLILPMVWVIRWRRQWARKMIGMCAVCGYDLRATPDRCPECGAIPECAKGAAT